MNRKREESIPVQLARNSIMHFLETKQKMVQPKKLPPELANHQAGVFVSIKKGEHLRGCIGTFLPAQKNVALEIIENAISAATRDPRFSPVKMIEMNDLSISVDILSPPQEIEDISQLDPKKYGVIVSSGSKKGLLLPNLDGVDSVELQIDIAKRKAGIFPGEKIKLSRFEAKRYH